MGLYAGLEGGATSSKAVLLDDKAKLLAIVEDAPSTNVWLDTLEQTQERIHKVIHTLRQLAGLNVDTEIDALGLCLTGCNDTPDNQVLAEQMTCKYPELAKLIVTANDTIGSLYTATPNGGVVLISGTGSNCLLLNSDGSTKICGGLGHVIGDQGSAFNLSQRAVKSIFSKDHHYKKVDYDTEPIRQLIYQHFNIDDMMQILDACYSSFKKSFFAGLCGKIAKLAIEKKDPLALHLFWKTGRDLARHVNAILPFIDDGVLNGSGGLHIVCVGSVFQSWPLLQKGFMDTLSEELTEFTMEQLELTSAYGAAYLAARSAGYELPIHQLGTSTTMFHWKRK